MTLRRKISGLRQSWRKQCSAKNHQRIEKVAEQLYQGRIQSHQSGSAAGDWAKAEKIVQNPLRYAFYIGNQPMKPIVLPPKRWFAVGISDKTSWEWMELLIIPLFLAVGAFYLENQIERRQERIAFERYQQESQIADERAKQETLTSYFEQMKELLLSENLRRASEDSEVRSVARAITTTAVGELDSQRNRLLLSFLQESNLIRSAEETELESEIKPLSLLVKLDFSGAALSNVTLRRTNLRRATFRGANLTAADLSVTDLSSADFSGATLREATFFGATLREAIFSRADLSEANLSETDLSGANLVEADLRKAAFINATLSEAIVSESQLEESIICQTLLPEGFALDPNRDCPD